MYAARGKPAHLTERQYQLMMTRGAYLWAHMGDAPVILIPCLHRPVVPSADSLPPEMRASHDAEFTYVSRIRGASIYPAVQNIILACRALCLGTTNHDQPPPLRGRGASAVALARRCRHLRHDADRLAG
jgi:hypothetical protein